MANGVLIHVWKTYTDDSIGNSRWEDVSNGSDQAHRWRARL